RPHGDPHERVLHALVLRAGSAQGSGAALEELAGHLVATQVRGSGPDHGSWRPEGTHDRTTTTACALIVLALARRDLDTGWAR
ncbi:MAG: hypothetical protein AAFP86_02240, partial [Planctomycetota bacterium]